VRASNPSTGFWAANTSRNANIMVKYKLPS
jgi:hypothetical protein